MPTAEGGTVTVSSSTLVHAAVSLCLQVVKYQDVVSDVKTFLGLKGVAIFVPSVGRSWVSTCLTPPGQDGLLVYVLVTEGDNEVRDR